MLTVAQLLNDWRDFKASAALRDALDDPSPLNQAVGPKLVELVDRHIGSGLQRGLNGPQCSAMVIDRMLALEVNPMATRESQLFREPGEVSLDTAAPLGSTPLEAPSLKTCAVRTAIAQHFFELRAERVFDSRQNIEQLRGQSDHLGRCYSLIESPDTLDKFTNTAKELLGSPDCSAKAGRLLVVEYLKLLTENRRQLDDREQLGNSPQLNIEVINSYLKACIRNPDWQLASVISLLADSLYSSTPDGAKTIISELLTTISTHPEGRFLKNFQKPLREFISGTNTWYLKNQLCELIGSLAAVIQIQTEPSPKAETIAKAFRFLMFHRTDHREALNIIATAFISSDNSFTTRHLLHICNSLDHSCNDDLPPLLLDKLTQHFENSPLRWDADHLAFAVKGLHGTDRLPVKLLEAIAIRIRHSIDDNSLDLLGAILCGLRNIGDSEVSVVLDAINSKVSKPTGTRQNPNSMAFGLGGLLGRDLNLVRPLLSFYQLPMNQIVWSNVRVFDVIRIYRCLKVLNLVVPARLEAAYKTASIPQTETTHGELAVLRDLNATFPGLNVQLNSHIDGIECDLYLPDLSLNIELDGRQHRLKPRIDRARDKYLMDTHGITTKRVSYQLNQTRVARDLIFEALTNQRASRRLSS